MPETPQSLLERLAHDPTDLSSWGEFVRLYNPFLARWSNRLAALPESDHADVVQNVLTVVVKKLPEFKHNQQPGAFRSWLKRILPWRARVPDSRFRLNTGRSTSARKQAPAWRAGNQPAQS